jgi:hypothetical protein
VKDSKFCNCSSTNGGAILVENQDLEVTHSHFHDNFASANGGAISLHCDTNGAACDFKITDSEFFRNYAKRQGGAVDFDLYPFEEEGNLYDENRADFYGDNFGSYPF